MYHGFRAGAFPAGTDIEGPEDGVQKLYEDRWKEQARLRRFRFGLGSLALLLALVGSAGRYSLARVRLRNDRLIENAVEPLEQTSLYGLELDRPGSPASDARMDSLERAYSDTYLDPDDIRKFAALEAARRDLQSHPGDAVRARHADEAFRRVVQKNVRAARTMAIQNDDAADEAGWAILVVALTGSFACLAFGFASVREERSRGAREELALSLIESAPDAILIVDHEDQRIIAANPAAESLLGLSLEEMGNAESLFFSPPAQPDGRTSTEARQAALKRMLKGEVVAMPWTVQGADGRITPCEARLSLLPSADGRTLVRASFLEVTAREAAQQALARSEARFRTLVEDASLAIRITLGGRTVYANRACVDLFGYPDLESLLEVPHRETYHPDHRERIEERFRIRAAGGVPPREYDGVLLRKDGSHFHVHVSSAFVKLEEGEAVVAFLVDTTESVHAAEREEAQREQLVHADRLASLGVLLAGMAHEINNPNNLAMFNAELLAGILSEAEPVLDEHHARHPDFALSGIPYLEMKPEVRALLEGIRGSTVRIRDIIAGLKDFSRRNPVSEHRPVDLSQVAQSALLLVGNLVRKSTDRFESDLEEDLPKVDGDPQRLEQVVVNLLTNACQALPSRDRLLRVRTRMSDSGTVELEVEDEGVGIAAENLPKILDPFFTTKREEGGTGLGLAVSWGIVQAHRGQLTFLPREGGGTRAILRIPVSKTEVNG
jgi:PAS domain S-box-containing protein